MVLRYKGTSNEGLFLKSKMKELDFEAGALICELYFTSYQSKIVKKVSQIRYTKFIA